MSAIFSAVIPVFAVIMLGFAFRRAKFPGDAFWPFAERMNFFVFFPALLFLSLARTDLAGVPLGGMTAVILAKSFAMTFALVFLRVPLGIGGPQISSVVQGAMRFNSYLGVAVAGMTFGADGLALSALYVGIVVPLSNVIAVPLLAIYGSATRPRWDRIAWEVVKNPLVIAGLAGAAVNLAGGLPVWIDRVFGTLGQASLTIGLLCVGAGLNPAGLRSMRALVALTTFCKLVLLPLMAAFFAWVFGVDGLAAAVLIVFSALPAAPASYILARQMGGDAPLMAAILTTETAISALTIPIVLALLAATGLAG
ncbi:MAG: AEC family transporter [Alphaproteobacteria bacterium]|nr:AEC family transporter [Alphaproteobacteria bacterium]